MITYNFNLAGKVAVVTGDNGVLTSVFAEALAEHGAKVALVSRRLEAVLDHECIQPDYDRTDLFCCQSRY